MIFSFYLNIFLLLLLRIFLLFWKYNFEQLCLLWWCSTSKFKKNIIFVHSQYSWFTMASLVAQMVKNPRVVQETWSVAGSGKFLGEGDDNPLQHSCLENPMDRRAMGQKNIGCDWAAKHTFSMLRHSESVIEIFFSVLFPMMVYPRMFNIAACPPP